MSSSARFDLGCRPISITRAGARSVPLSGPSSAPSLGGLAIGGPSASIATARAGRSPRTLTGGDRPNRPAPAAALCRAFEISRRREVPSFSHHAAVAALAPVKQDTLLDQVEREGALSVIERMREAQAMLSQIV